MKDSISPQDLEHISAYLDGQLSAGEQARLEARLHVEPALRQEVAGLRAVAQMLRGLPQVRVPRNFTLSPEMARRQWSLPSLTFPTLRLATAFATAAFAFVLVLDFNASRQLSIAGPAAVPEQARQGASAPTMAEALPEESDSSGEGETALELAVPEQAATLAQTSPEATPAPTQPGRALVEPPSFAPNEEEPSRIAGGGAGPEETPVASEKAAEALRDTPLPDTPTPTPAPPNATQPPAPAANQADSASEVQLVQVQPPANPYRPVTLGLAGLAVLLGALTLVVRRFA